MQFRPKLQPVIWVSECLLPLSVGLCAHLSWTCVSCLFARQIWFCLKLLFKKKHFSVFSFIWLLHFVVDSVSAKNFGGGVLFLSPRVDVWRCSCSLILWHVYFSFWLPSISLPSFVRICKFVLGTGNVSMCVCTNTVPHQTFFDASRRITVTDSDLNV